MSIPWKTLVLLLAGLMVGCLGTYYSAYRYKPRPVARIVPAPEQSEQAAGRVLASIIGVRRATGDIPHPASVEVRLRIENRGDQTITLLPASLELVTAGLRDFPQPAIEPSPPITIPPGHTQTITAYFPFPAGAEPEAFDLGGLNLSWRLRIDGRTIQQSVTFTRRELDDDDYPRTTIGFGVGIGAFHLHHVH